MTALAISTDERKSISAPSQEALLARLKPFEERCHTLAARVTARELSFIDAVDMAYSAATWSGIIDRYGDDAIQRVMAAAFMGAKAP